MTGPRPAFQVHQSVRVRPGDPAHHTRVPGYLRGHTGRIRFVQPAAPLPDDIAAGVDPVRSFPVYTVAFASAELWREAEGPGHDVLCDLWECYLEPAMGARGPDAPSSAPDEGSRT